MRRGPPHARYAAQYLNDLWAVPRDIVVHELEVNTDSAGLGGT